MNRQPRKPDDWKLQSSWDRMMNPKKGNGELEMCPAICDGCNQLMNWDEYRSHDCPAYGGSHFLNPLDHKMKAAQWKIPKVRAELHARGSIRPPSIFQRFINWCLDG